MTRSENKPITWVDCSSDTKDFAIIPTPVGNFVVYADENCLVKAEWVLSDQPERVPETEFLSEIVKQVNRYWQSPDIHFTLPLLKQGTEFQRRVWQALIGIPCSQPCSYTELAGAIHTGARAIGNACRNNPFPLIIPCHRVISVTGQGGYAGHTRGELPEIKKQLLAYEASF